MLNISLLSIFDFYNEIYYAAFTPRVGFVKKEFMGPWEENHGHSKFEEGKCYREIRSGNTLKSLIWYPHHENVYCFYNFIRIVLQ